MVSSSLNWLPSSPRSYSKVQPGYLKSGSPPGASITPSSDTNSVTTIRAAIGRSPWSIVLWDKTGIDLRSHRDVDLKHLAQRIADAFPPDVVDEVVLTGSVSRGMADDLS